LKQPSVVGPGHPFQGGKLHRFAALPRRAGGIPELIKKYKVNLTRRFPAKQQAAILELCMNLAKLEATPSYGRKAHGGQDINTTVYRLQFQKSH
jgi:hypothetical protein